MVELRLLGPMEVVAAGRLVEIGPPQRRGVLAALAVDAGRPVTVEVLVERVWGGRPPEGARRSLHAHIARIRRTFDQIDPVRLVRRSGGYALNVDRQQVDLHRFRDLLEGSRRTGQDDGQRSALLREALGLWRGQPLADLSGLWFARVREGWLQERLDAVLAWARVELRLGNPTALIGPLTDLAGEHPLVEPLVEVLMRALYAAGRPAQALRLFADTRGRLVEELGTDPGTELREVHEGILRGDLDPGVQSSPPAPAAVTRVVPAQLPHDVRGFAGRDQELARLDAILAAADRQPTAVTIAALTGTAGVGKSALAVHWAHRVRDRFPDGQLYVNLRGFDPSDTALAPVEAVRAFLDALALPPQRIPDSLDAQTGLYRSLLAGRRVLVVLDNARDDAQVRPLLPGSPGCLVLVTSRRQLGGLVATEGAYRLRVAPPSVAEARDLLAGRIGATRVAGEPEAVNEIIARCARLPLALAIVAARAAQAEYPLAVLAGDLRHDPGGLSAFDSGDADTDVRTTFSWSYRLLGAEAARLFRLLAVHPGPDVTAPAAASLAGLPAARLLPVLAELTRANLLTDAGPGRFVCHDLLRDYATELTHRVDSEAERRATARRIADHYLHTAYRAALLLNPNRHPITPVAAHPGVTPERLDRLDQARAWFGAEYPVLLGAIRLTTAHGFDPHTWQLAWTLNTFVDSTGHWEDWVTVQSAALAAAERSADPLGCAHAHRGLALALYRQGRHEPAHGHFLSALRLFAELGDAAGEAYAHLHISWNFERQGQRRAALRHSQQALELHRAAGDQAGQAGALNAVGWSLARLGEHQPALAYCQQALALFGRLGARLGQAAAWDSLGYAHHHLGHYEQASGCYQRAIDLFRASDDRYHEAEALTRLGDTRRAAGNPDAARRAWQQALGMLTELRHPDTERVQASLDELVGRPSAGGG